MHVSPSGCLWYVCRGGITALHSGCRPPSVDRVMYVGAPLSHPRYARARTARWLDVKTRFAHPCFERYRQHAGTPFLSLSDVELACGSPRRAKTRAYTVNRKGAAPSSPTCKLKYIHTGISLHNTSVRSTDVWIKCRHLIGNPPASVEVDRSSTHLPLCTIVRQ